MVSLIVEHGFEGPWAQDCGSQAVGREASLVAAHRLGSCDSAGSRAQVSIYGTWA